MKRLSHSTQAIQFFREEAARPNAHHNDKLMFPWLASCLSGGVKFVIPDVSMIFDGGDTTRGMELVRLPYPVTVLEYELEGTLADGEVAATKRIAMCFSPSSPSLDAIAEFCGLPTRSDEDGIYIITVYLASGVWFVPPVIALVRSAADPVANPRRVPGAAKWGQRFEIFPIPLEAAMRCYRSTDEQLIQDLVKDVQDEVCAAVAFCKLMNCSNVHEEVVPAPKAINASRARKGKPPLFEYRTLVIDVASAPKGAADSQGENSGRASPRQHLRRGHIRRLGDRLVWVNAALIGSVGRIEKDYKIRGRQQ